MNRRHALPYLLPYALYVAVASIPATWLDRTANYGLRLLLVGAALAWGVRRVRGWTGPANTIASIGVGAVAGLLERLLDRDTRDLDDRAAYALYREIALRNCDRRTCWEPLEGQVYALDPAQYGA